MPPDKQEKNLTLDFISFLLFLKEFDKNGDVGMEFGLSFPSCSKSLNIVLSLEI